MIKETEITDHWQDKAPGRIHDPNKAAHMAVVQDKWRDFAKETSQVAQRQADVDVGPRQLEFMAASRVNSDIAVEAVTSFGPEQVQRAAVQYDQGYSDQHFDAPVLPPEVPPIDPRES